MKTFLCMHVEDAVKAQSLNLTFFCCRFGCRPVSPCVSASRPMPLCAASWSTSPDVTLPSPPSPSSRVSRGNASGRRSLPVRCALSASRPTPRCVFRPLLRRRLRTCRVLRTRHQQWDRTSRLRAMNLLSHIFLSWRGRKGRTLLYLHHYPISCGKRQ